MVLKFDSVFWLQLMHDNVKIMDTSQQLHISSPCHKIEWVKSDTNLLRGYTNWQPYKISAQIIDVEFNVSLINVIVELNILTGIPPSDALNLYNTHLLTPWCRVLLEKLTGLQLVKKFPAFHGTRRFITALTSVRHPSLPWVSPIQSIYPHPTSWRSILILSTNLRLGFPSGLFPSGFPTKTLYTPPHPSAPHAQPIQFFPILSPAQYWVRSTNHTHTHTFTSTNLHMQKVSTKSTVKP
jgi:hypothetical protein